MAYFSQKAGSPGEWSNKAPTLTIQLGETAQILLQLHATPGGSEELRVTSGGLIKHTLIEENPTLQAVLDRQRLFKLTPNGAGDVTVYARDALGLDLRASLNVVVVPRKLGPQGPEHVIMYSGKAEKGQEILEAYRKSAPGALVQGINSLADFETFLRSFRDPGRTMGRLEFNTHGKPGRVSLGSDGLTAKAIVDMRPQHFHKAFAKDARVFFHGCNVAEGRKGEEFLEAFAQTFFIGGGGRVGASTSLGFGTGNWVNGKVYHLWGMTKYVTADSAGKITERKNFDALAGSETLPDIPAARPGRRN